MGKKTKSTITIPFSLAELLAAGPSDVKNPKDYENVQDVAKALLRVLISAEEGD